MAEPIGALHAELSAGHAQFAADMGKAKRAVQNSAKGMETSMMMAKKGFDAGSASLLTFKIKALAAAAATGLLIKSMIKTADEYTLLDNKLKVVTKSQTELANAQEQLYQISLRSHVAYGISVDMYQRFQRSSDSLGTSQAEVLRIVETLNKAMIIGGSTSAEASNALIQLAQGFAAGALRGEEFRSVVEQTPRVTKLLTDYLKTDIGGLRKMAYDGKLTADILTAAFSSAAQTIDEEFGKMQPTISQAMTDLRTVFGKLIADSDQAAGGTNQIATEISNLAKTIGEEREGIIELLSTMFFMAGKVVKAFGNIGQSIRGWAAVKRGDLGFFEFSGMNADELDDWLKKYDGEASRIQQQIDRKTAELRSVIPRGTTAKGRGQYADQIQQLKDEIAALEAAKADLAAKTAAAHATPAKKTGGAGSTANAGTGGGKSGRDDVSERGQAAIKDLERELALLGDTTEVEKVLWELENGRYADLSTAHKARIETLTREIQAGKEAIDAKKAEADAAEEADKQRIASMEQLMGRMQEYYEEHDSAVANFEDDYRQAVMTTQEYELAKLQERYDAYAEHIEDKAALDRWYEEESAKIAEGGKKAASDMSEFQIQAYRSMQSAMSEFLFDPFEDGLDGMLRSFADMIRKLLAEALAAQILKSLLGGDFGSGGKVGGLLGGLFGAATGIASSGGGGLGSGEVFGVVEAHGDAFKNGRLIPFAHGGIVDRPTVFPMAQGAGLMGEAGPEAVLPLARTAGGDLGVNVASEKQQDPIENNVRIINVLDPSVVGNYLSTAAGERMIVNYMQRNKKVLQ